MHLARIVGAVVTPRHHPFFERRKLLVARRVGTDGTEIGPDRVAVDSVGSGIGDLVLVLEEGNSARQVVGDDRAPLRSVIVGYVDEVEIGGRATLQAPRPSDRGATGAKGVE